MHKDRSNLGRIDLRIKPLRLNRLNLMISSIERLPKTPPAASRQLTAFSEGYKIRSIGNQLAIYREHRSQRAFDLRR